MSPDISTNAVPSSTFTLEVDVLYISLPTLPAVGSDARFSKTKLSAWLLLKSTMFTNCIAIVLV